MVKWDESNWELENMVWIEMKRESLCEPDAPGHVVFPEERSFEEALKLCQQLGAPLSVVRDQTTQNELIRKGSKIEATTLEGDSQSMKDNTHVQVF